VCIDLMAGFICRVFVDVENVNGRALLRKFRCDSATDAAARTSDNGNFTVQLKRPRNGGRLGQSETPRFQGMKSSCAFCSALIRTSPLAT